MTILSTASAGVGALLVLLIFKIQLSVIALIGSPADRIVKKNASDGRLALQAEREQHSRPRSRSVRLLLRFVVMMTTMAALLGALPLMLGRGPLELRQRSVTQWSWSGTGQAYAFNAGRLPVSGPLQRASARSVSNALQQLHCGQPSRAK